MSTPWLRMKPQPEDLKKVLAGQEQSLLISIHGQLTEAIPDEAKALQDYKRLANDLRVLGERSLADKVLYIARQESDHRITLLDIQTKLRGKYQ